MMAIKPDPRRATIATTEPGRALRVSALVLGVLLLVSGCGLGEFKGVHSLPLPGGADLGENPYTVKARFDDVSDLVPNAGVRVNDVPVGRVSSVELADGSWNAEVTMSINSKVELPENALAEIRQSSLLGEKYVELYQPPENQRAGGKLGDGDVITVQRTGRGPEVEEVLGALSLLLNGGGIGQIQNIARELNTALDGREADTRQLLSNLDELVSKLDARRDEITAALDSVNRLGATLREQRANIDVALRDLQPGLKVLNRQREQLVTMLESLDELSGVATDVVNRTKEDLVHNLRKLQPVLRNLAAAGANLPKSLEILFTYPFTDDAVKGIKGDYTNLFVNLDLNLTRVAKNLGRSRSPLPGGSSPGGSNSPLPDFPLPLKSEGPLSRTVPDGGSQGGGSQGGGSPDQGSEPQQGSGGILDQLLGGN